MRKMFKGSLVQNEDYGFRYQYKNLLGKKTTVTLHKDGKRIFKKGEAEKAAFLVWKEIAELDNIKTKGEATQKIAEAKGLITQATFKLSAVWSNFAQIPKNQNTRLAYRRTQWNCFVKFIEEKGIASLADVTSEVAQAFMTKIKQNIKATTYNDYIITLRLIFKTIAKSAGLNENPFDSIEKLAITDHAGHKALSDAMISKIVETVNAEKFRGLTSKSSKRIEVPAIEMRILIQLGLSTGMRLKDAVLLSYDSIDQKQGLIKINTCKGIRYNKRVIIPIMPPLKNVIEENGTGYVTPTLAENYLSVGGYTAADEIQHLFAQAGITVNNRGSVTKGIRRTNNFGFHSFRHVFVSRCAAVGIPQAIVEAIVGTNSEVLKKYYTHVSTDSLKNAMKLLS